MKKIPLTLCVILVSTALLASLMAYLPAGPAVSEGPIRAVEKYVNDEKHYSIEYPKEWQRQELPRLDLVLFSPARNTEKTSHATMNIISENVGETITLDQFYNESVKHLKADLQEPQIENSGDITIDHIPAKWVLYNHQMMQNKFRVLQYFIVSKGTIFLLTFSSAADDFDHFRSDFERIASSFRVLKQDKVSDYSSSQPL